MKNNLYALKLIFFIIIQIFNSNFANSEVVKKIIISGNDRVSNETVVMFSNIEIGSELNDQNLNIALKDIYSTNYFKNVTISQNKGIVKINVIENPIIQSVIINGIKDKNLLESINDVTIRIEKYPFVENQINDQVKLLKNILKSYGYYFVELKTSVTSNQNNTVDLIYNFDLGEVAKIKKINFIGDKFFRDNTLRNVIISEESKFWKFITRNKYLDSNRVNLDIVRLQDFYKNRGFFNVNVKSTTALITSDNQFELVFNINSGKKYFFNDVKFESSNEFLLDNNEIFIKKLNNLKGETYSKKDLDDLIDELNEYILQSDYVFLNTQYKQIVNNENQIDVIISFDNLEKKFVQRINILGNYITDEKVIRNSFIIDEGDPYNEILFNRSIQNLKARNLFKNVEYKILDNQNLSQTIDVTVEEKATGEIFAGAGTGTTGTSVTGGVKENNYLGLGIKLDTNLTLTEETVKGKFSVENPNYNNSDKLIKVSLESSTNDYMSSSGYKTSRTGLSVGTEFEQMNDLYVNLELSNFYEDLETSSSANNVVKKQEGNYFENLVTYSLSYNRLDQNYQPTKGFINKFSQTFPLYSDDISIENSFSSSAYHAINDNLILSANFLLKSINSLDDNVRVSKRVNIPSRRLRGFESGKIGPKDGNQYIGGNYATSLNLNSTIPNILFENENIDFNLFVDLANVWEVDYDSSLDSNELRSSTGIAVNWFSTIGPLTFSYAIPLSEAKTDITENFRFQIGTSF